MVSSVDESFSEIIIFNLKYIKWEYLIGYLEFQKTKLKEITKDHQRILNNGTTQKSYKISTDHKSDLDYLMFLIKQKYNSLLN